MHGRNTREGCIPTMEHTIPLQPSASRYDWFEMKDIHDEAVHQINADKYEEVSAGGHLNNTVGMIEKKERNKQTGKQTPVNKQTKQCATKTDNTTRPK